MALEAVSGMKVKEAVEGVKTAVSTQVEFRSSPGTFFLGISRQLCGHCCNP